jgi:hypothetical protein
LPSRQMPSIVHHAGLGVVEVRWLITDVMATAIQASYGRQEAYFKSQAPSETCSDRGYRGSRVAVPRQVDNGSRRDASSNARICGEVCVKWDYPEL